MQSFYLCFHKEAQITHKHNLHQFPERKKNHNGVTGLHIKSVFKKLHSQHEGIFGVGVGGGNSLWWIYSLWVTVF